MTTPESNPGSIGSAIGRGWRGFRRWRRGRPFWAGVWTVLAGVEIYYSTQLTLGQLQLRVGMAGLVSYVVPAMLVVAGVLLWFTPAQRMFYGVLTLLVSVASLILVNFGGFLLGTLLGMLGGALAVAWSTQGRPAAVATAADPDAGADPAVSGQGGFERGGAEQGDHDSGDAAGNPSAEPDNATAPRGSAAGAGTSPLVDVLPSSRVSPLSVAWVPTQSAADPVDRTPTGTTGTPGAAAAADPPDTAGGPDGPGAPHRRSGGAGLAVVLACLTAVAAAIAMFRGPVPVAAAPCAPAGTASASVARPGGVTVTATATTPATATPTGTATSTAGATGTAAGTSGIGTVPALSAAATTSKPAGTASSPAPCTTSGWKAAAVKPLAAAPAANQPLVNGTPSTMRSAMITMTGLSYDGVVDLPTQTGSIRSLLFTMDSNTSTPFELDAPGGGGAAALTVRSSKLSMSAAGGVRVHFYTSRFEAKLSGLDPVVFTPDNPPVLTAPDVYFTDATIQLVYTTGPVLTAQALDIQAAAA